MDVLRMFNVTPFFVQSQPVVSSCHFHLDNKQIFPVAHVHIKDNRNDVYSQQ